MTGGTIGGKDGTTHPFGCDLIAATDGTPNRHIDVRHALERGKALSELDRELVLRACQRVGVDEAVAPRTFPLDVADHLRADDGDFGAFGVSVTVPAGTSRIEPRTAEHPGTPAKDVTLSWPTSSAAANEAGMSRRYGGIHFESGDLHGRSLGAAVGGDAWVKAQSYIRPFNTGPI